MNVVGSTLGENHEGVNVVGSTPGENQGGVNVVGSTPGENQGGLNPVGSTPGDNHYRLAKYRYHYCFNNPPYIGWAQESPGL